MKLKTQAVAVSANRVQNLEASPSRSVEKARIAFLTRRLRIEPPLAAIVAAYAFGEARGQ